MDPELQALMRKLLNMQVGQTEQNEPLRQAVSQLAFRRLPIHARAGFTMPGTTSERFSGGVGGAGGGGGGEETRGTGAGGRKKEL